MNGENDRLADRFLGSVFGAAIGDALAFPYQHYSREFLRSMSSPLTEAFVEHHSSFYPTGQYSDDTQMMVGVLEAIVEAAASGEPEPSHTTGVLRHLVPLWRDQLLIERDASCAEAVERLLARGQHWTAQPLEDGRAESSAIGRVLGIALWYHHQPGQLLERVEALVRLTHTDRRTVACAAGFAAAVAYNLTAEDLVLGDFLDRVAVAAGRFDSRLGETILDFPRILSMTEYWCQKHFECVYQDDNYPPSDEGLGVYSIPAFLFAFYFFLKNPHCFESTVDNCLRLGGQMDTTTFLAGAVSGSRVGFSALPKKLTTCLHGNSSLSQSVEKLYRLWRDRHDDSD